MFTPPTNCGSWNKENSVRFRLDTNVIQSTHLGISTAAALHDCATRDIGLSFIHNATQESEKPCSIAFKQKSPTWIEICRIELKLTFLDFRIKTSHTFGRGSVFRASLNRYYNCKAKIINKITFQTCTSLKLILQYEDHCISLHILQLASP